MVLPRVATARTAVRARMERTSLGRRGVDLFHAAESAASEAADLPARLLRVLGEVESLMGRVGPLIERMEDLTERAAGVLDAADETVGRAAALNTEAAAVVFDASEVSAAARVVIERAHGVTDEALRATQGADALLGHVEPVVARAAPLAEKFVGSVSPAEVEAAIKLVDELPRLTDHLRQDILPILATLDRAGPDLQELVKVSYDVRRAILGIPGFGFFKRRGEEALADVEDDELREEPHVHPAEAHAPEPEPEPAAAEPPAAASLPDPRTPARAPHGRRGSDVSPRFRDGSAADPPPPGKDVRKPKKAK